MGRWESDSLRPLKIGPGELGARVLGRLGLPMREELRDLAKTGAVTLDLALAHDSPELLADYLAFAARRIAVLTPTYPTGEQAQTRVGAVVTELLPPANAAAVAAFLSRVASTPARADVDECPCELDDRALRYLDLALDGRSEEAVALVVDEARRGTDLAVVLIDILEAAQREIGRREAIGAVSVAQEHYCTALTQLAMSALYPFLFTDVPDHGTRRRLVAAQAGGSLHEVGLRMVVDLLEHEGWDTTYLGAESDPVRVIAALIDRKAEVLAISASMPVQIRAVAALVGAVRADPRTAAVKVVVGGRLFLVAPGLATEIGADGMARNAREAVTVCARLTEPGDVAV